MDSSPILLDTEAKKYADADVQVDVKLEEVQMQMNSKEANEWLEIAITALSVHDHQKAEQYLVKFNNMCPSDQVKMMLDKIQLKISQMPKGKENEDYSDPEMLIVDRFIDIAYKAIAVKDLAKAQDFLNRAEKVKPTQKAQKLLENVSQEIANHKKETAEQLIECAMTALDEDDYDLAEMLLETCRIKYNNQNAQKILEVCIQKETDLTKHTVHKTDGQKQAIAEKYAKKAENLIAEGQLEVAESFLIIASHTCENERAKVLLNEMHTTLYPKTESSFGSTWYIGVASKNSPGYYQSLKINVTSTNLQLYRCAYFVSMACRSYYYAGNPKLARDFLSEAQALCPSKYDVKRYFKTIDERNPR